MTNTVNFSYFQLYDKKLRVEVWDWNWLMPNLFLGSYDLSLVEVAQGDLTLDFDITQTIIVRKKKKLEDVGLLSFVMVFQEDQEYVCVI